MEKIKLDYDYDHTIARLTLDNGKGNVLDSIMMEELYTVLHSFRNSNKLKLISFEGAGKHFSFGASVEEHTPDNAKEMLRQFHRIFYELVDLSIPTMACVSGQCLGGGMELAIMCNFLFADQTARFGQPEIILGVFPPPASILLPFKIGATRAEELLLTGKIIGAVQAKSIGLINETLPNKDEMKRFSSKWIEDNICSKSASSLKYANTAARIHLNEILKTQLPVLENIYLNQLMKTNDADEGIKSFLENRKPVWVNN